MKKAIHRLLILTAFLYIVVAKTQCMETNIQEIWKDVVNYEGYYQISNQGRVKSLSREVRHRFNGTYKVPEKILRQAFSAEYLAITLHKNGHKVTRKIHIMSAMAFHGHIPSNSKGLIVNHIDTNKLNNWANNLELTTLRVNGNKKHIPHTSKYTGVSWDKQHQKWLAQISIKGKSKKIGRFHDEYLAHLAYEDKLKSLS